MSFIEEYLTLFANKQEHKRTKNAIKAGLVLVVDCLVKVEGFVCFGVFFLFWVCWGFFTVLMKQYKELC